MFKTYPDTRFTYALLMVILVLDNWAMLILFYNDKARSTAPNGVGKAPCKKHHGDDFDNAMKDPNFKKKLESLKFLLGPLAMVPLADNSGRLGLQPDDRDAVARVLSRFFPESPAGQAKALRVLHEFDNYVAGEGQPDLYCKGKLRCFSAICTRAMDRPSQPAQSRSAFIVSPWPKILAFIGRGNTTSPAGLTSFKFG